MSAATPLPSYVTTKDSPLATTDEMKMLLHFGQQSHLDGRHVNALMVPYQSGQLNPADAHLHPQPPHHFQGENLTKYLFGQAIRTSLLFPHYLASGLEKHLFTQSGDGQKVSRITSLESKMEAMIKELAEGGSLELKAAITEIVRKELKMMEHEEKAEAEEEKATQKALRAVAMASNLAQVIEATVAEIENLDQKSSKLLPILAAIGLTIQIYEKCERAIGLHVVEKGLITLLDCTYDVLIQIALQIPDVSDREIRQRIKTVKIMLGKLPMAGGKKTVNYSEKLGTIPPLVEILVANLKSQKNLKAKITLIQHACTDLLPLLEGKDSLVACIKFLLGPIQATLSLGEL